MAHQNGIIATFREHAEKTELKLDSIEKITADGLREVTIAVKELSGELKQLRTSLIAALVEQQREQLKASNKLVYLTLGTVASILISVIVWVTGIEPHLPKHSILLKHAPSTNTIDDSN